MPRHINITSLRSKILNHLAAGVAGAARSFDRKTGRFLADNGGWAVTRQDIIFPLALLYTTPGTKHHRSPKVLELALRGGDALRDAQGKIGDWEFVKIDGSRWGRIFMPWSIYHWLEAFALLRDSLDNARLKRWARGLTLACEGVARELGHPMSHNIPCWKGMSLVRAGQLFDRADWREIGARQERYSADHQHPDGYWPEGDGPTTHYNLVYIHSLGLYHAFTGDRHVLPALRRAAAFHAAFTYPDASSVETVDGRVKYTPEPHVTGLPGLGVTPEGRAIVQHVINTVTSHASTADNKDTTWRNNQSLLSPHIASAHQHLILGPTAPTPATTRQARVVHRGKAVVLRDRPWFATVSGYVPSASARHAISRDRWIMSRTNLFSLFHDRLGLVIGGGNSKHDPAFATYELTLDGVGRTEPDRVSFKRTGSRDIAVFHFGKFKCHLTIAAKSVREYEIGFELPPGTAKSCQVTAGFTMRIPPGDSIRWHSHGKLPADARNTADPRRALQFHWTPVHGHRRCTLETSRWTLHMPIDSGMQYPAYPFNPYAIDNAAPPGEAVASIFARFTTSRRATFALRIR